MKKSLLIKWHRHIGWIAGIAILLWGLSGLLHPLMTWTSPRPASFSAPVQESFIPPSSTAAVTDILLRNGIESVSGLNFLPVGSNPVMQVTLPGAAERIYLDMQTGMRIEDADRIRAVRLARHYAGDENSAVRNAETVAQFSNAYPYVNRYLPAWKITFDRPDGLTVYVDTDTGRLGSISDNLKVTLQTLFQTVHTGQFLQHAEPLRLALTVTMVISIVMMACLGLALLPPLRRKGKPNPARRLHRWLAFAVWIPLLMFSLSGLFHLIKTSPLVYDEHIAPAQSIHASDIAHIPSLPQARDLRLIAASDGTPWWHIKDTAGQIRYLQAATGDEIGSDESFSSYLAGIFSPGASAPKATKVTHFSNEYGFANKRLPVWRIEGTAKNVGILFIEPQTATLAARTGVADALETWSFSALHKWQFLNGIGPENHIVRDLLMTLAIAAAALLTLAGFALLLLRK